MHFFRLFVFFKKVEMLLPIRLISEFICSDLRKKKYAIDKGIEKTIKKDVSGDKLKALTVAPILFRYEKRM